MSPILPQYTKSPFRDDASAEDDRLLGHPTEGDDSRTTYPPAPSGAASSSSSVGAEAGEAIKTFALPSHLCNYELDAQFRMWRSKTTICGREATKAETIDNLVAAFPCLARRHPSQVCFKVPCPPPAGSSEVRWSEVTDSIWDDVMVRARPDNLMVAVKLTYREFAWQYFKIGAVVGSPIWAVALIFLVMAVRGAFE